MKPILFPPSKGSKTHHPSHSPKQIKAFLLKYFPKYISDDLNIDLPKGSFTTRVKRIKLIKNLSLDDTKAPHKNLWRLLVANKAKTIRYFKCTSDGRYSNTFSKSTLQKLKMFSGQQELPLSPPNEDSPSSELHYLKRFCSSLGSLNNLRVLELYLADLELLPLLAKVNKNDRVLSHLKTFSLSSTCQEYKFFQTLFNSKTVLKYLTDLYLDILGRKEFFQILQQLPSYCEKLHDLSFSTSQKELTDANYFPMKFNEKTCLEDENYLKCLQYFKALKKLRITSYHNLAFLQNARLPPTLQDLHLSFSLFAWENSGDFTQTLTPLHSSLKNLTNLQALKFWFSRVSGNEFPSEKYLLAKKSFMENFLKNIPRLTQLIIRISAGGYLDSKSAASSIPFDLFHFLGFISHLSDSLEVLQVVDGAYFFRFITESSLPSSLNFPKLSSLRLVGEVSSLDLARVSGLAPHIELEKINVESFKKLLNLFLLVAQVKGIEKKQVKLKINVENLERDLLDEDYFKENYEEVKKQIQGVNLKNMSLAISASAEYFVFMKEISAFRNVFGKFILERPYYTN